MTHLIKLAALCAALAFAGPPATAETYARQAALQDELTELAFDTLNDLQKASIKAQREYCGYIGVTPDKELVATRARGGTQASCMMPRVPRGIRPIATYHTHGAFDLGYDNETPSYQDLRSDIDAGLNGFISTPGGRLWFSDKLAREVRLICSARCMITDPRYSEQRHDRVEPAYSLKELAER